LILNYCLWIAAGAFFKTTAYPAGLRGIFPGDRFFHGMSVEEQAVLKGGIGILTFDKKLYTQSSIISWL